MELLVTFSVISLYTWSSKKRTLTMNIFKFYNRILPLERHKLRWEDNIKMDIQEVGCGGMDWIELAHVDGHL